MSRLAEAVSGHPYLQANAIPRQQGAFRMSDKTDQAKGRVKEAVGSLTDDDDLKREGKTDRLAGEAKEKVGEAKDKVEEGIDKIKDAVHRK
jgi:uncharacterized protein YjbJ (UPF0337 family)